MMRYDMIRLLRTHSLGTHSLRSGLTLAAASLAMPLALSVRPVQAQNIVANPGFEDGSTAVNMFSNIPDDYSETHSAEFFGGALSFVGAGYDALFPHTGQAFFGGLGGVGNSPGEYAANLSQKLTTTPGDTYDYSFFFAAGNNTPANNPNATSSSFGYQFGSVSQTLTNPATSDKYEEFSGTFVASGPTTKISFTFNNPQNVFGIDDIYVADAGPAAVPEASTTVSFGALLALGLGGVVLAAKKRKQTG